MNKRDTLNQGMYSINIGIQVHSKKISLMLTKFTKTAWRLVYLSLIYSSTLMADDQLPSECRCANSISSQKKGVVWTGQEPPKFDDIVKILAPVLWYTNDEPSIINEGLAVPQQFPCDPVKKNGVLYYQVNSIIKRTSKSLTEPVEEDVHFAEKVQSFGLRYYFYHNFDYGLNPHQHDLEMVELRVAIERTPKCYEVRLNDIIAFAHSTDWYSNELLIEPDTKLPITLLIEEGKHASAPDRNADGIFTPGYDINTRIHDAWGLRDIMGSGYLLRGNYESSMSKPRSKGFRVLPPPVTQSCVAPSRKSIESDPQFLSRYELRPGYKIPFCENVPNYDHMIKYAKLNNFGSSYHPPQAESQLMDAFSKPITGNEGWFPKLSFRYDRHPGIAMTFNGFDFREIYLVPKFNWVGESTSIEALVTQSAVQFMSSYFSFGFARERLRESDPIKSEFVSEFGVKFRLQVDWPWRIFGAGYEFAGIRVGVRNSGFSDIGNFRFIVEFGSGLW
jgi:hypothetical protein